MYLAKKISSDPREALTLTDFSPSLPPTMRAARLHRPGLDGLSLDRTETPRPAPGEAVVAVHAAAITRDELEWPLDRLPAVPSYELSGTVAAINPEDNSTDVAVGDDVYALTSFERDGNAAEYAAVAVDLLAPKPATLSHVEAAAVPLPALSAVRGLFAHGHLEHGETVLITGASGGVGHFATQLARVRGARVATSVDDAGPVDLVFDTAGGETLQRAAALSRPRGRLVSVAQEPPATDGVETVYFVVEPDRAQLEEITRLIEAGEVRPAIDSVYSLEEVHEAFRRTRARGKHGKVVVRVAPG
jgi:NADPH:quinone reductase-like Zn-dependent oxidoreductase